MPASDMSMKASAWSSMMPASFTVGSRASAMRMHLAAFFSVATRSCSAAALLTPRVSLVTWVPPGSLGGSCPVLWYAGLAGPSSGVAGCADCGYGPVVGSSAHDEVSPFS